MGSMEPLFAIQNEDIYPSRSTLILTHWSELLRIARASLSATHKDRSTEVSSFPVPSESRPFAGAVLESRQGLAHKDHTLIVTRTYVIRSGGISVVPRSSLL